MKPLLSVHDVAELVGLSEYTVRQAVREGDLRAVKLRGRVKINEDDLADWIAGSTVRPSTPLPAEPAHFEPPTLTRELKPGDAAKMLAEIRAKRKRAA